MLISFISGNEVKEFGSRIICLLPFSSNNVKKLSGQGDLRGSFGRMLISIIQRGLYFQSYVLKRNGEDIPEKVSYIDYVQLESPAAEAGIRPGNRRFQQIISTFMINRVK